jgi:hypothetical protein
MPKLQIVPINVKNQTDEQLSPENETLPVFYMSDYSIMALRVNKYHKAIQMLENLNFRLDKSSTGVNLISDNFGQIEKVIRLLQDNRIQYDLSDIVTRIYQG